MDYTNSDIENFSDHELPLSSITDVLLPTSTHEIVNNDICKLINCQSKPSTNHDYKSKKNGLISKEEEILMDNLNNSLNTREWQEIYWHDNKFDIETFSDHELPVSSITDVLLPTSTHKIINNDISKLIYCHSKCNTNHDYKSKKNGLISKEENSTVDNLKRKYECDICEKIFLNRNLIIRHFKTSLCFPKNCYYFENYSSEYNRFYRNDNSMMYNNSMDNLLTNNIKNNYSKICHTISQDNKSIKYRQILHTKENNFKCNICSKTNSITNKNTYYVKEKCKKNYKTGEESFSKLDLFKTCQFINSKNNLFICNICNKSYINLNDFKKHIIINSLKDITIFCQKYLNSELKGSNYNNRIQKPSQNYKCFRCSKIFHKRAEIINHIFNSHQDEYSKYSCDTCLSLHDSSQEIIMRFKKDLFKCVVCPQSFITSYRLGQHYKWHIGLNNFTCQYCLKTFSKWSVYLFHERTHTVEKPFRCNFCGIWFPVSSNLNIHLTLCNPFVCGVCHKTYTEMSSFLSHIKIHSIKNLSKSKNYNRIFSHSTILKVHRRLHTGRHLYKCYVCYKSYMTISSLDMHSKTHDKKDLYAPCIPNDILTRSSINKHTDHNRIKCELCQELFINQDEFIAHKCSLFKCKCCSKMFNNTLSLEIHNKTCFEKKKMFELNNELNYTAEYNMNKEYKCDICAKIFYSQPQISNHVFETHY